MKMDMLRSICMQSGETVDSVPKKKKKKKTATEGRTCGKGPRTQTPNTVIVWSKVDLSSIELRFYAGTRNPPFWRRDVLHSQSLGLARKKLNSTH